MGNMQYNREHTKTFLLRFNLKTDKDILERLASVGNKQAYVKRLIRQDLQHGRLDIEKMMDNALDDL